MTRHFGSAWLAASASATDLRRGLERLLLLNPDEEVPHVVHVAAVPGCRPGGRAARFRGYRCGRGGHREDPVLRVPDRVCHYVLHELGARAHAAAVEVTRHPS